MPEEAELSFEDAVSQLEAIVEALEQGEPSLATALARYETGVQLLGRCHGMLERAERSVAVLTGVDAGGVPATEPFDAKATLEAERSRAGKAAASKAVATASADAPTRVEEASPMPVPAPRPPRARRPKPVEETEPDRFDPPF